MRKLFLHIANLASVLLPQTRCFAVRRWLYRLGGADIAPGVMISGTARIHYPNVSVAAHAWIGPGVQLVASHGGRIAIGEHVGIGPGAMFSTGTHEIGATWRRCGPGRSEPVSIGDGSWIGTRATFVAGSGVGRSCVVAAGAVVTKMFPDNVLIAGVPAKVVRTLADSSPVSDAAPPTG